MAWHWTCLESFEWITVIDDLNQKMWVEDSAGASVDSSVYKTGSQSLKLGPTSDNVRIYLPTTAPGLTGGDVQSVWMGFHIRHSAFEDRASDEAIVQTQGDDISSGVHANIRMTSGGVPTAYRGTTLLATGSSGFSVGTWQWVEIFMTIADSGGRVLMAIDGTTVIDFTGDTQNGTTYPGKIYNLCMYSTDSNSTFSNIDNLFVKCSNALESDPTFYDECYITTLAPDADGNYSAWSSTASPTLYTEIDDAQTGDSPATYISSSTSGQKASFSHQTFTPTNPATDVVKAVAIDLELEKNDPGAGTVTPFVRTGGSDYSGDETGVAYGGTTVETRVWENKPGTSPEVAWTDSDINAAEFGVEFT